MGKPHKDLAGVALVPSRKGFADAVTDCAAEQKGIVLLGSDVTGSLMFGRFKEQYSHRFFSLGIAEQNAACVAAGMAKNGLLPVMATYATFCTTRALDQIRVSICYNEAKVVIGGAHAGISVGPDGATHQALEDIAIMRSLPGMTVISPCDANECYAATRWALGEEAKGPVYIRFGRAPIPNFTDRGNAFTPGEMPLLRKGKDLLIVATGAMVWESLRAAELLEAQGVEVGVVNLRSIKPIDKDRLIALAQGVKGVVTVEEHQVSGGMGGAVSEVLSQYCPRPMRILGMRDCFGESGEPAELLAKFGLDAGGIAKECKEWNNKF